MKGNTSRGNFLPYKSVSFEMMQVYIIVKSEISAVNLVQHIAERLYNTVLIHLSYFAQGKLCGFALGLA